MDAFQEMIAARRRAYAERLPKTDSLLSSDVLEFLKQHRAALASRLVQVEQTRDVTALATTEERKQWARVLRAQARLARDPDTPVYARLRERLALVRGVLLYRMDQEFAARLWNEHKQLRSFDTALTRAQERWTQLESGRQVLPAETGDFAGRVSALQQRIGALQVRLEAAEVAQSRALAELAVRDLEQQKKRLQAYRVQAQFALATIYDQAAHADRDGNGNGNSNSNGKPRPAAAPAATGASPGVPQS
jgi:chromosome segregation ATPase